MDETLNEQLTQAAARLAGAAEALENALARIDAQHQELNTKVERIVAAIDDTIAVRLKPGEPGDAAQVAELKEADASFAVLENVGKVGMCIYTSRDTLGHEALWCD